MFAFVPTNRIRPSPFFEAVVAEGLLAANLYNRMIIPISYGDREEEYWRFINGVSQWDVSVERQVQLQGRDAGRLVQILFPARPLALRRRAGLIGHALQSSRHADQ